MKYFLLVGGFCGFTTAFIAGLAVGRDLSTVLCDATIGCLGGAMLLRGFRAVMTSQLRKLTARQTKEQSTLASTATASQA
jgi:hypothetical protein